MSASEKERENMSLYSVLLVDDEEEVFQVIILNQRIRNNHGTKLQHTLSVDSNRIFAIFSCTIC